jgi:hypothetical protein
VEAVMAAENDNSGDAVTIALRELADAMRTANATNQALLREIGKLTVQNERLLASDTAAKSRAKKALTAMPEPAVVPAHVLADVQRKMRKR